MLTPFDIRDRVSKIHDHRRALGLYDSIGRARVMREVFQLYREVLAEIARGSLDARSLALAALEVEE